MSAGLSPGQLGSRIVAIIGAGPTGLGAAYRLAQLGLRQFTVFEQGDRAGGLAASYRDAAGFTWDIGGHVQFSHYRYFDTAVDQAMAGDWCVHDREAWIWMRDRFVPYPLQNNIHLLPDAEKKACLLGLLRRRADTVPAADFAGWVRARFGDGLAEVFLLPYNAKVWAYPPSELGHYWIGERVAQVDLERVILSLVDNTPDVSWGPNRQFKFPATGGTGEIWRRIAAGLPPGAVRYGARITSIDVQAKCLSFEDGTRTSYDVLVSTMPLDRLCGLTGLTPSRPLKYSTVHVFGFGFAGAPPTHLRPKCWIYYPEDRCPFYRLTVFSNYSPANVPDASRQWSVMVEVSESFARRVDRERLLPDVWVGLRHAGVIGADTEVLSEWQYTAGHGYPTPFLDRDAVVRPLLAELERHDIFSRGRFGAWKYEVSNQDHSFMQGVELVDRLDSGADELTLLHPEVVNAGIR